MMLMEMSSAEIHAWLETWDTETYLREQHESGRAQVGADWIARYANDHDIAAKLAESCALGSEIVRRAELLKAITAPIAALRANPIPNYYAYTGLGVLDLYLDVDRLDLEEQKGLCIAGLRAFMLELARFEAHSLLGVEPSGQERFDENAAMARLRLLKRQFRAWKSLAALVPPDNGADAAESRTYSTLGGYCRERHALSAAVDFTCVPRTRFHDEVLFLRTLAQSEICFYGISLAISQANEAIERRLFGMATTFVREATAFVGVLHEAFHVLQTMPPEHFDDFRDATDGSSAVQSFRYQELDIALFGLDAAKVSTFAPIPHLQRYRQYARPGHASLRSLLAEIDFGEEDARELADAARELDRRMLSWRGLHMSFPLRYLKPGTVGTGGTSGPEYLRKFLRHTLFDDTTSESRMLEALGEEIDFTLLLPAHPSLRITPPEQLWILPVRPDESGDAR